MKTLLKKIGIILSIGLILGSLAIYFFAPYLVIQPMRQSPNIDPTAQYAPAVSKMVESSDGTQLSTVLFPAAESKGVVIFVHGIGGYKESFYTIAKGLANEGISCITFDLRAHGQSEGEFCTYGAMETKDVRSIVSLAQTEFPNQPIGIWGNSLGGAIAIQSLEKIPELKFGIIESTFADLSDVVLEYQTRTLLGFRSELLRDFVLHRAGVIA
ncbi:MAG: alpha/beta fold hydrolase, partial [Bacteroidota bacterium]